MSTRDVARFRALHEPGNPLRLVNVWDAGSARTVETAGAAAVATTSWAMAAALGMEDGERLDFGALAAAVRRISEAIAAPLSVDIERGYAENAEALTANVDKIVSAGAVGINIEDSLSGGGLRPQQDQTGRLRAIRERFARDDRDLFINARCDAFFGAGLDRPSAFDEACRRASVYEEAGADGLFVPGLTDPETLRRLRAETPLPLNVMMNECGPPEPELVEAGVARISFGPHPWLSVQTHLGTLARDLLA
jgi:2-methylisocitrate lyase-like PEP mutase family enzyme